MSEIPMVEPLRERAELVWKRAEQRLADLELAYPSIRPPAAFWLVSDAGPSYCRPCAVKARAKELKLDKPPQDGPSYRRSDKGDEFFEGIDGGFDTNSEHAEHCDTCGDTLSYILTDYGVDAELDYIAEAPITELNGETSYSLDRIALNIWPGANRKRLLGVSAAIASVWRLLPQNQQSRAKASSASVNTPE